MGVDQHILCNSPHDVLPGGMPPAIGPVLQLPKAPSRILNCLRPPNRQPCSHTTPPLLPLCLQLWRPRLLKTPCEGTLICVPPPGLAHGDPLPRLGEDLPVNSLAHFTLPLQEALSRFPLILHTSPPTGSHIPPAPLMKLAFDALQRRVKAILLKEWATQRTTHPYYIHRPSLPPQPFMGLGKFVTGRIDQRRSRKSYLATHLSWFEQDEPKTCPRCYEDKAPFEHTILQCTACSPDKDLLMKEGRAIDPGAPLWSGNTRLQALSQYIPDSGTRFPSGMPPCYFPPPHTDTPSP